MRLLFIQLEKSATLALAFCHAHELAVQDIINYGALAEWDEGREREQAEAARLGVHVHLDDLLEHMKINASQQVPPRGFSSHRSCSAEFLSAFTVTPLCSSIQHGQLFR